MRLWSRIAVALVFVPLVASAQFSDLDAALQNLTRGFGGGDPQAIVAGIAASDKVMLQFPGLISENGRIHLRAANAMAGSRGPAMVISSVPFDQRLPKMVGGEWSCTEMWLAISCDNI